MRARVHRTSGREFDCCLEETKEVVSAQALGNLHKRDRVVVGDYVTLKKEADGYTVVEVQERTSEIFRILVRESKKKVTASNIDRIVILMSVSRPAYKRGLVDRFLVRACQWGIRPLVVFNKMDEYDEGEFDIVFEKDRLERLGAECFEMSAKLGDDYQKSYLKNGIEELKKEIQDKTTIFLGHSGVGKSKTISYLSEGSVDLKTNVVAKVGKGSHTTTWSELIPLPLFTLIDSPGIRTFSLDDMDPKTLIEYFPDLEELAVTCKFSDCTHQEGVKGCAFYLPSLEGREKRLLHSRLESFHRIKEEIGQTPFWAKKV